MDNAPEILPIFTRIEKVRFRRPVVPGDHLLMEARLLRTRRPIWWFKGTGTVDGKRVAEGEAQATMGTRTP